MSSYRRRSPHLVLSLAVVGSLAACGTTGAHAPRRGAPEGKLITAEQIHESGARDAWEALQRAGTHLTLKEGRNGDPVRMTHRGRSSIVLDDSPLVVVDGVPAGDIQYLRLVPAHHISGIRVLGGVAGTKYHGARAGGGVILIHTRTGPEE